MKNKARAAISFLLIFFIFLSVAPLTVSAAMVKTEEALIKGVGKNNTTTKLMGNIVLTSRLVIPSGVNVTLDLNNFTLSRDLEEIVNDGNVIYVEKGASLTITDTSSAGNGAIGGGKAYQGGGIYNEGSVTLIGGTISGNTIYHSSCFGGGIYNAGGATLNLSGGKIIGNSAKWGGGVYCEERVTLNIQPSIQTKTIDGTQKKIECSVTIADNYADAGGGIYTGSNIILSGGAELSGNENGDVFLDYQSGAHFVIRGELKYNNPVGVAMASSYNWTERIMAKDYGKYHTDSAERFFHTYTNGITMHASSVTDGDLNFYRNYNKTVVEAYDHGKLIYTGEYDKPADAWKDSYKYWTACWYYFDYPMLRAVAEDGKKYTPMYYSGGNGWESWYKNIKLYLEAIEKYGRMVNEVVLPNDMGYDPKVWQTDTDNDEFYKAGYSFAEGHLQDDYQVKITLGSDWKISENLLIWRFRNVILDLNGHCINRGGKKAGNGYLFFLEDFAKLTIIDSDPESDGFDDLSGGVLTGGNGDDKGGGLILNDYSELDILGGTVYNCRTDEHGGAIYAGDPYAKINLKDCAFVNCQTKDSGDDCNGGAVYIKHTMSTTMENVRFYKCASEDNGGAIYITNRPGVVKIKNCVFEDNYANDYGGAIQIKDIDNKKMFVFEVSGCKFIDNHCAEDGGAVCVSDNDDSVCHYPIVFRNCEFTGNRSDKDGSVFELDDNSVAFIDCTITGNPAKGIGAVYVNDGYMLSVGGKTVIKENVGQDVILDDDGDKTRVYSIGLLDGSDIHIDVLGKDNIIALKGVPESEVRFFTANGNGRLEYRKTGDKTANLVMASVFGSGALWIVIAIAGLAVIAGLLLIVLKKTRNGRQAEENE